MIGTSSQARWKSCRLCKLDKSRSNFNFQNLHYQGLATEQFRAWHNSSLLLHLKLRVSNIEE